MTWESVRRHLLAAGICAAAGMGFGVGAATSSPPYGPAIALAVIFQGLGILVCVHALYVLLRTWSE